MSEFSGIDSLDRVPIRDAQAEPGDAKGAEPGYPAYPAALPPSLGDAPHLLDYVRVVYKRRWLAGTTFLFVVLLATAYAFTATPIFEATTKLLIESDDPNVVSFKEVIDEQGTKLDYYQTQYNILQSRSLARRTIDRLGLWRHEEFAGSEEGSTLVGLVASGGPVAVLETEAQSVAIDRFLERLKVSPVRNSRIVDVKFRSIDPALAARIANELASGYIEQNLEYKFASSQQAADWLGEQLSAQRKQVEAAEAALQRYKEANDAISLEDRENIYVQKLTELNTAVTRAKTERLEKEALYNQLRAIEGDRASLDSFPSILANPFIQQQKGELANLQRRLAELSDKLGEKHPEIIRTRSAIQEAEARLQAEVGKVVHSVRNEYLAAQAQENSLVGALEAQKREALSMSSKGIEYGVLQREVESSRQIYDSLLQRAKETGVSAELRTSNIRVVDQAEKPRTPASPRRTLTMVLSLLGGTGFAICLAFFFEYLDNRIKTPEEIRGYLGLPSLGMLPAIGAKGGYPLVTNGVPPNFAEAFRSVRTNVVFASADEGPRSVLVTSTGPGEGKTMVAGNLAASLAQAGQRVVLVDADMRKPKVGDVFHLPKEPGLSNLLVGNAKASESIHKGPIPGLWLLPAGHIPPNPAELLGSQRFKEVLASLKEHFDWVVIDSPPVMAVVDAAVAAHLTTGVLFVVGAEMTNRYAAKTALDQLENARAKFVGAVLNRVEVEKNKYYYSNYYRKEYSAYYTGAAVRH
jgi:capsular exopolysaccharide synthesis family protein